MAFETKNPTLKNIIYFLKNQLSKVATDIDSSIGDSNNWYGRKNGNWSNLNLQEKAPINSPTFTGSPEISTTPTESSNNHKIADTAYVDNATNKIKLLKYTASGITDNNRIFNNISGLEGDMVPVIMYLSNPSAQSGDWTISTTTDSFTITGSITGNTNADFYFMKIGKYV